jgi:hypothetical protein
MPRFLSIAAGVALALLALGPPALADSPVIVHERVDGSFTAVDLCGSGMVVDVVVSGVHNIHLDGESFQGTGRFRAVATNPATGRSAIVSSAGQVRVELLSGDPHGLHTHLVTFKGLAEKIQVAGGEVLLRDAGFIAFADTFDGHQFIGSEVVINRGPHPEADSDFRLFCDTMVAALS